MEERETPLHREINESLSWRRRKVASEPGADGQGRLNYAVEVALLWAVGTA